MGACAGGASAQSNVTIYGLVDLGVVRESGGPAGSMTKLTSGIANGSRLGFKGIENLGGDLSAFFQLENGFQADTGTLGQGGLLFGRQAFVGLSNGFGTIKLGRQYTPIDDLVGAVDPFGNGYAGRLQNVFMKGYLSRVDNDVMYSTPTINGFSANVAYGFGEVAGSASANRYVAGSAGYTSGPLFVRIAHQNRNNLIPSVVGASANTAFGNATNDKNTMLGATYNFGVVKAHAAYAITKTGNVGTRLVDATDAMVGVSVPFGANTVMASYIRRNDKSANNRDADQIAIGYNYVMSKRTTLYAAYAYINNKNGPVFYTAGSAIEGGSGNKALDLGIRHTF
ncbi:porin [Undibacterium arcticum]|uniref:porin n=1 Tax=Undibacterium arcticum TaxID=1762892 RepID=UPI0036123BA0